jgi:hypothetical protein
MKKIAATLLFPAVAYGLIPALIKSIHLNKLFTLSALSGQGASAVWALHAMGILMPLAIIGFVLYQDPKIKKKFGDVCYAAWNIVSKLLGFAIALIHAAIMPLPVLMLGRLLSILENFIKKPGFLNACKVIFVPLYCLGDIVLQLLIIVLLSTQLKAQTFLLQSQSWKKAWAWPRQKRDDMTAQVSGMKKRTFFEKDSAKKGYYSERLMYFAKACLLHPTHYMDLAIAPKMRAHNTLSEINVEKLLKPSKNSQQEEACDSVVVLEQHFNQSEDLSHMRKHRTWRGINELLKQSKI